ncbi:MAG: hypothetical protein U0992_11970 [Planctomycetaceae bacterium]
MNDFLAIIADALRSGQFASLVVSRPRRVSDHEPRSIRIRPIELRSGLRLQWTSRFDRRETHENLTADETLERLPQWIAKSAMPTSGRRPPITRASCRQSRGEWQWKQKPATRSAEPQAHDRSKQYLIPEGTPCPFLEAIGVTTAAGQVRRAGPRQVSADQPVSRVRRGAFSTTSCRSAGQFRSSISAAARAA